MLNKLLCCDIDETEEEFATRLANNLENLILEEGPETVKLHFLIFFLFKIQKIHAYMLIYGLLIYSPFRLLLSLLNP